MPPVSNHAIEPGSVRFERVASEHTWPLPLVFGEPTQDSPERSLRVLADVSFDVVAIGGGV
jgi:hypothetical protein